MLKGKNTNRSWPQLPQELVRAIATHYLYQFQYHVYVPQGWETRETWHQRMVFLTLSEANELEHRVMRICPEWAAAMQTHPFWLKGIQILDPLDIMAPYSVYHPKPVSFNSSSGQAAAVRLNPYHFFRTITGHSCLVCRINAPASRHGLAKRKVFMHTPYLRQIGLCSEHGERAAAFCGLCLRDAPAPVYQYPDGVTHISAVAIVENEDKEGFPNVFATCRSCRSERLWKFIRDNPRDREALGGRAFNSDDWETRNAVDSFIDSGEGTIKEVIATARERLWLKSNTRMKDMLDQALAASRFNDEYEGNLPDEDEEEEDEEVILMQMEEDGVRDLALGDWARSRIMDGHWISPAGIFYDYYAPARTPFVRSVHPCPWMKDTSSMGSPIATGEEDDGSEDERPRPATIRGEIPPTFSLCEQAFQMHRKQLRTILLPAMRNLVRKIVIECATPCFGGHIEDPCQKVGRMGLDDVLAQLREEDGVWFDGIDWAERRSNSYKEAEQKDWESRRCSRHARDGSSTTSSGGSSGSPSDTSPVLSTSTLQTTPSPPPSHDDSKDQKDDELSDSTPFVPSPRLSAAPAIAVGPVLDPPKLLQSIPYIPKSTTYFPPYTRDEVSSIWREACSPLYHCRCKICLRSIALENAANGVQTAEAASEQGRQAPAPIEVDSNTVKLEEATELDGEGEEELEYYDDEEVLAEIDGAEELSSDADSTTDGDVTDQEPLYSYLPHKALRPVQPRPRKRSCEELDVTLRYSYTDREHQDSTPPKRAKVEEREDARIAVPRESKNDLGSRLSPFTGMNTPSPGRQRKRSSEELEDFREDNGSPKKARRAPAAATPPASSELSLHSDGLQYAATPPPNSD